MDQGTITAGATLGIAPMNGDDSDLASIPDTQCREIPRTSTTSQIEEAGGGELELADEFEGLCDLQLLRLSQEIEGIVTDRLRSKGVLISTANEYETDSGLEDDGTFRDGHEFTVDFRKLLGADSKRPMPLRFIVRVESCPT